MLVSSILSYLLLAIEMSRIEAFPRDSLASFQRQWCLPIIIFIIYRLARVDRFHPTCFSKLASIYESCRSGTFLFCLHICMCSVLLDAGNCREDKPFVVETSIFFFSISYVVSVCSTQLALFGVETRMTSSLQSGFSSSSSPLHRRPRRWVFLAGKHRFAEKRVCM